MMKIEKRHKMLGKREIKFQRIRKKFFKCRVDWNYIQKKRGDLTIRNESQKFIEFQIAHNVFLVYAFIYIYISIDRHCIYILKSHRNNRRKENNKKKNINGLIQLWTFSVQWSVLFFSSFCLFSSFINWI